MGISMFGAICWHRANRYGAFSSLLLSSGLFFYLTQAHFGMWLRWDATNFGISLLAGFVALVVVSRLTRPESESRLKPFYERLDTRSELDEATQTEKVVTEPGHDLLVVHLFDSGITKGWKTFYRRFRVDILGLLAAFGVVVVLIAMAKAILFLP